MEIIIDDRERTIIKYIDSFSKKFNINFTVKRLEIGDYAITYCDHILLVIERKTWDDLAASIRDGRKDNIKKLLSLRSDTGCDIAYLIEGKAFPKPDKKFKNIPYKNLRAHLDHLAFRDNVHMLYSEDYEGTAYRLFELAKNYSTIKNGKCKNKTIDANILHEDTQNDQDEKDTQDTQGDQDDQNTQDFKKNIHKLSEKQKSTININNQILQCLPHIGSVVSTILSENGITLSGIFNGKYSEDDIASLKYTTGAVIGLEKAKKIINNKKYLRVEAGDQNKTTVRSYKIQKKILSSIPLISANAAEAILDETLFSDIMDRKIDVEQLKNIKKSEKTKLGQKAAENIIKYCLSETT